YLLLQLLIWLESVTWGAITDSAFMTYIPLFPLAMIGGIIVQLVFSKMDQSEIVDRHMINRIQGFALDILIVSAIGTISLDVIGSYIIPFLLLAITGIAWNVFGVLVLAPRIIPSYLFERAIGDFGQSTGVTATGLLLMRVVDACVVSFSYVITFLLLAITCIELNVFGVLVLAPRIIPSYWFERAIGDFGQSTGVTATGLLLMRVVDPDNESPALESKKE